MKKMFLFTLLLVSTFLFSATGHGLTHYTGGAPLTEQLTIQRASPSEAALALRPITGDDSLPNTEPFFNGFVSRVGGGETLYHIVVGYPCESLASIFHAQNLSASNHFFPTDVADLIYQNSGILSAFELSDPWQCLVPGTILIYNGNVRAPAPPVKPMVHNLLIEKWNWNNRDSGDPWQYGNDCTDVMLYPEEWGTLDMVAMTINAFACPDRTVGVDNILSYNPEITECQSGTGLPIIFFRCCESDGKGVALFT